MPNRRRVFSNICILCLYLCQWPPSLLRSSRSFGQRRVLLTITLFLEIGFFLVDNIIPPIEFPSPWATCHSSGWSIACRGEHYPPPQPRIHNNGIHHSFQPSLAPNGSHHSTHRICIFVCYTTPPNGVLLQVDNITPPTEFSS